MARKNPAALPVLEALEERQLMSGTVTVTWTPTSVKMVGDAAANVCRLYAAGGVYAVDGQTSTTIVQVGTPPAVSQSFNATVDLKDGDDFFTIFRMDAKNVTIKGGEGNDSIYAAPDTNVGSQVNTYGKFTIDGGEGNDTINFACVYANKAVSLKSGNGNDTVNLCSTNPSAGQALMHTFDKLKIDTGAGDDVLTVATNINKDVAAYFDKAVSIKMGLGNDIFMLANNRAANIASFFDRCSIDLGAGNDRFDADAADVGSYTWFSNTAKIKLGAGDDFTAGIGTGSLGYVDGLKLTISGGLGVETIGLQRGFLAGNFGQDVTLSVKW